MVRDIKFPGKSPDISLEKQEEIYKAIKEDSTLPNHIQAKGKAKKPSDFRKILLTGVTGHLGPYLLQQLSQQENLTHIFCLVRASSIQHAEDRVIKKLKVNNILEKTKLAKIHFLRGDVSETNLGLDENSYSILSNIIDAVVHNAVYSNHVKSYPISEKGIAKEKCPLRSVNVIGVKNILEFASVGVVKHVLHGSSFSCVNRLDSSDGRLIEELPNEDNLGDGIAWGYANSKFVGEKLVKTALERGIPVTVIRYPAIMGDSTTGFTNDLDNLTMVMLSLYCLGLFPETNFGIIVCPVDICALIATNLFFNDEALTGVYNLNTSACRTLDIYKLALKNGVTLIRESTYEEYMDGILNNQNTSNQILEGFKTIYLKGNGMKEFFHLCPAMRLLWYDPYKYSGRNEKLKKYVPDCENLIPTPEKCDQIMFDFFKSSGLLSALGVKFNLK